MRIMILGATGFLGRNLTEHFATQGHEIHAVRFTRPAYQLPNVVWHHADLRQPNLCEYMFSGIDVVIQLAACSSGCKDTLESPALHICNNAVMNSYIMKAAVDAKVKHVIFPSCSVMLPNGKNDETVEPKVRKEYAGFAWTKIYCEKLCEFYAGISDTKFTVMRNSNFYGPYDKFDLEHSHVFGATITKVMQAQDKIIVWGSGEEARDFVYVSDFCDFVERIINNQPSKFGFYNCGAGQATTINDLVGKIIGVSGKQIEVKHNLTAPSIPTSLSLDCGKAARELGWMPKVALEEGIAKTLAWWRGNVVL